MPKTYAQMAAELEEQLHDVLDDHPVIVGTALNRTVVGTVRRYFADQIQPPGPCIRPRCGHPADWHRIDDAANLGPCDPGVLFRCIGYDPTQPGPPPKPGQGCKCPDMVRSPDPRPDGYVGGWPPVCGLCGHVHTPGEQCADHTWRDECPTRAGRYCGREHLVPDNVPPCGIVGHSGCTWQVCNDGRTR